MNKTFSQSHDLLTLPTLASDFSRHLSHSCALIPPHSPPVQPKLSEKSYDITMSLRPPLKSHIGTGKPNLPYPRAASAQC
ncbi:uncharacterized protein BDR25DRAFT_299918 [Lindgomyces ingoldianus]|uniref:Uncharacterized protein n=1 Tax=Lindgomyces ingoldianus TaxID=673940 RepID=A0ACB6RIX8_9PLEO|nr:uncharacterized protein BDR25DRAFT_299918 [Lindgomyces ingoldianus]KAF2478282.1 hypothetical protein BDR25DRAFT_299918 [Lindgomyces ingoldianus]